MVKCNICNVTMSKDWTVKFNDRYYCDYIDCMYRGITNIEFQKDSDVVNYYYFPLDYNLNILGENDVKRTTLINRLGAGKAHPTIDKYMEIDFNKEINGQLYVIKNKILKLYCYKN